MKGLLEEAAVEASAAVRARSHSCRLGVDEDVHRVADRVYAGEHQ